MERIRILNPHTANQIAAGEVIERPASIVKELVENAIDAGASAITVEVKGGGIEDIRVTDNGSGIPSEDALLAFSRHATSKIAASEDLDRIATLGFRGEALASIAAVAHVKLITRTAQEQAGTLIRIDGGELKENTPAGAAEGTMIQVSDIFYNLPARKKFLKSARSEASAISDYMARLILSMPGISFKLVQNDKVMYQSAGDDNLQNAIYCVYGSDVFSQVLPISYDDGYISLSGFAGKEQIARPTRTAQSFYINSRYIRSSRLSFAVQNAFDTRLMTGRFPFVVLHIKLSPQEVDVNVHPQKLDVRFRDEQRVARAVTIAVRTALGDGKAPLTRLERSFGLSAESAEITAERSGRSPEVRAVPVSFEVSSRQSKDVSAALNLQALMLGSSKLQEGGGAPTGGFSANALEVESADLTPPRISEAQDVSAQIPVYHVSKTQSSSVQSAPTQIVSAFGTEPYTTIGQLFNCYWVVQQGESVFFIDQHAAHERQLYESLMQTGVATHSQLLLVPEVLKLSPVEYDLLMDNLSYFTELGFDIEEFGAFTISVRAVPHIIGQPQTQAFLHDALASLSVGNKANAAQLKRDALIQSACKHAVKAGAYLSSAEIGSLLEAFANGGVPFTCPHGRPVMVQMRKLDFEKLFKRVL